MQKTREALLKEMLRKYNEGRSKSYYCIAATVLEIKDLKKALSRAANDSRGLKIKDKAFLMRSLLDQAAGRVRKISN